MIHRRLRVLFLGMTLLLSGQPLGGTGSGSPGDRPAIPILGPPVAVHPTNDRRYG